MRYGNKPLRHELKYFIHSHEYVSLKNSISRILVKDRYGIEDDGYHIRSLYFDDILNSAYHEKENGIDHRKKYRIRIYNNSDSLIKLERKEKFGQYIGKEAVKLSKEQFYRILDGNLDFLLTSGDTLMKAFYVEIKTKLLKPKVIVDYEREAYICKAGNVRITFDKKLQAGVYGVDIFSDRVITVNAIEHPKMILEIKYDDFLPGHVRSAVQLSNYEYCAISKYVICRNVQRIAQRKEIV